MDFLKKLGLTPSSLLKGALIAVGAIVALTVLYSLFGQPSDTSLQKNSSGVADVGLGAPSFGGLDAAPSGVPAPSTESRFVPTEDQGSTGSTAEQFESTSYRAAIETRKLAETCGVIAGLKPRDYVIFENASETDTSCGYFFKVARSKAGEILEIVKALDPKDLIEDTSTIKRQIDDLADETEILKKRLKTIEDTLDDAVKAYDDITRVAVQARDAESLAKIIDGKLQIVNRLTNERLDVSEQLDRLSRAKTVQLDRLEFTYFSVHIVEKKYIDWKDIRSSWQSAVRNFFSDLNEVVLNITVNLAAFVFLILQFCVYFLVVLIVAKYGWRFTKNVWRQ